MYLFCSYDFLLLTHFIVLSIRPFSQLSFLSRICFPWSFYYISLILSGMVVWGQAYTIIFLSDAMICVHFVHWLWSRKLTTKACTGYGWDDVSIALIPLGMLHTCKLFNWKLGCCLWSYQINSQFPASFTRIFYNPHCLHNHAAISH